jgi:hypothetical protein
VIIPCNDLPFLDIWWYNMIYVYVVAHIIPALSYHESIIIYPIYIYPIWSLAICSFVSYLVPLAVPERLPVSYDPDLRYQVDPHHRSHQGEERHRLGQQGAKNPAENV